MNVESLMKNLNSLYLARKLMLVLLSIYSSISFNFLSKLSTNECLKEKEIITKMHVLESNEATRNAIFQPTSILGSKQQYIRQVHLFTE